MLAPVPAAVLLFRCLTKVSRKKDLEVVARVLKPGVKESLEIDNVILDRVAKVLDAHPELIAANFPKLAPFVEDLKAMALVDTDIDKTTPNHLEAIRVYNHTEVLPNGREIVLRVPWLVPLEKGSTMMVMEFVKGDGFDDFIAAHPQEARLGAEAFMRRWLVIGFDKTKSFFHADAHFGQIRARKEGKRVILNILDYGMVTRLSPTMQAKVLGLAVVVRTHDPGIIARGLWDLSVKNANELTKAKFRLKVEKKMAELDAQGIKAWPLPEWLAFASNNGLRLPYQLSYFNRGFLTMTRLIQATESEMRTPVEMRKIMMKHPVQMLRSLLSTSEFSFLEWFKIFRLAAANKGASSTVTPGFVTGDADPKAAGTAVRCEALFGAGAR